MALGPFEPICVPKTQCVLFSIQQSNQSNHMSLNVPMLPLLVLVAESWVAPVTPRVRLCLCRLSASVYLPTGKHPYDSSFRTGLTLIDLSIRD